MIHVEIKFDVENVSDIFNVLAQIKGRVRLKDLTKTVIEDLPGGYYRIWVKEMGKLKPMPVLPSEFKR